MDLKKKLTKPLKGLKFLLHGRKMIEIYISWVRGLPQDKEALKILKESEIISGIELSNIDNQIQRIKDAGLKVSSHIPTRCFLRNLANPRLMEIFGSKQGPRILSVIRNSDAPTVGFHLGYSAKKMYNIKSFPNVPKENSLITCREELFNITANNIISLEQIINEELPKTNQKQLVLETLDYSRKASQINWEIQPDEVKANKPEILKTIERYGLNAGLLYVTDLSFIKETFEEVDPCNLKPIGLLFDVAHNLTSADTKRYNGEFEGTNEDYFDKLLDISNGRTYQLHINVPEGNDEVGYIDRHWIFTPGDKLSDYVLELTKYVVEQSPELLVVTLEMDTGLEPVKHAKKMIEQARYMIKKLKI